MNQALSPITIQGEGYAVRYDNTAHTVTFSGIMRLNPQEYHPIAQLLQSIADAGVDTVQLDFRKLESLNSSGVTMLAKFISYTNRLPIKRKIVLHGAASASWQQKSFGNFHRLMPDIQIFYEQHDLLEVIGENYTVSYDPALGHVEFKGMIRLRGDAYQPIAQLLDYVEQQMPPEMILNLQKLEALNSSGVTLLAKFIFALARRVPQPRLTLKGSQKIGWQKKSMGNFQRLMNSLVLEWE